MDGRLLDQSLYELTIEPVRSVRKVAAIEDMPVIGYERFDSSATTPCSPSVLEELRERSRHPEGRPSAETGTEASPPISESRAVASPKGPPPIPAAAKHPEKKNRRWISRLLGPAIRRG